MNAEQFFLLFFLALIGVTALQLLIAIRRRIRGAK
jgi:hypothetical protein